MSDLHQVNTIVASALLDCFKEREDKIDPEEVKRIAKCILSALNEAGFRLIPKDQA